jgi:hypothetical protein
LVRGRPSSSSPAPGLRDYFGALRRPSVSASGSWRDPLTKLLSTLRLLRHPGGLVRPFVCKQVRHPTC